MIKCLLSISLFYCAHNVLKLALDFRINNFHAHYNGLSDFQMQSLKCLLF